MIFRKSKHIIIHMAGSGRATYHADMMSARGSRFADIMLMSAWPMLMLVLTWLTLTWSIGPR